MEKWALSNPSRGSDMVSVVASLAITDFIDHHRFIDSVIGEHSYDSAVEEKCNVNNLLGVVNSILWGAIALVDQDTGSKEIPIIALQTIPTNLSGLINSICCQMTCEATRDKNVGERLLAIFLKLSSYRWTTQVVLVLAAFALQYGDFWYISEAPSDGGNALSTQLLKGLSSLKKKLRSDEDKAAAVIRLNNVVKDLLELTTSLVGLDKLVMQHRGKHVPELAKAFRTIPRWSCETIIAILAAGNYVARLIDDDKLAESELNILTSSLSDRKSAVLTAAKSCERQLGRMEDYQKYVKKVESPVDIVDFLDSLLTAKDSLEDPIVTGPNDTPVKFESFRKKSVLLIISDLKISGDDIETLKIIHDDSRRFRMGPKEDETRDGFIPIHTEKDQTHTEKETVYELVWIPIVSASPDNLEALSKFRSMMPWAYRVDPLKMNTLAPIYIKEEWHFKQETMVVVLDSFGWVENTYVMPMLRIWGTDAFPYTGNESTHPWRDQRNWVQLVLRKPVVRHETLLEIKDEYVVFCGGTKAVDVAADVRNRNPNLKAVPIEDMKRFSTLLRNCLICRLQALQILKEKDPLRDHVVYEMSEASKACQRGNFAILTKGRDLQSQYIGPLKDPKSGEDLVTQDRLDNLAEDFKKKHKDIQGQSTCLDICVPHYTGLGDLYCPGCSRFMRYDLSLMCCHSDSD